MKLSEIHIRDPFILPFEGKYYLFGTPGKFAWQGGAGFWLKLPILPSSFSDTRDRKKSCSKEQDFFFQ